MLKLKRMLGLAKPKHRLTARTKVQNMAAYKFGCWASEYMSEVLDIRLAY